MRHRMIPAIAVITLAVLLNGPVLAQEEPKAYGDGSSRTAFPRSGRAVC